MGVFGAARKLDSVEIEAAVRLNNSLYFSRLVHDQETFWAMDRAAL